MEQQGQLLDTGPATSVYTGPVKLSEIDTESLGEPPTAAFVASIRRFGVLLPVLLEQHRSRRYLYAIRDGRRRVAAAIAIGLDTIPANVIGDTGIAEEVLTITTNAQRSANPPIEFAAIDRMLRRGVSEKDIGRITGLSLGTLRKRMRTVKLCKPLKTAFIKGKIGIGAAQEAAALPRSQQLCLVTMLQENGKLTRKDVTSLRRVYRESIRAELPPALFDMNMLKVDGRIEEVLSHLRSFLMTGNVDSAIDFLQAWRNAQ